MAVKLNPYINLNGNARQALEFYKSIFGGELTISTFGEFGMAPDKKDQVMHGMLAGDNSVTFMVSDVPESDTTLDSNISMTLSGEDEALLQSYFERLAASGTVTVPLDKAPWGDYFGMLTDQFQVNWMVNISPVQQA